MTHELILNGRHGQAKGRTIRTGQHGTIRSLGGHHQLSCGVWSYERMGGLSGAGTEVFGLYELANDGTILYSRPRAADGLHEAEQTIVGLDFFRDIFPCQNIEDLRRHFRTFITGAQSVDSFLFDCLFEQETVRAKVFMTRAHETNHDHNGNIVIMDIRRAI